MTFFFIYLHFAFSAYDFVSSESPQIYSFTDSCEVNYLQIKGYTLFVSSDIEELNIKATNLRTNTQLPVIHFKGEKKNGFYSQKIELDADPYVLRFESQGTTIAMNVKQNVTSMGTLRFLAIFAIILVWIVILIVCYQFLTFHHFKKD